jgi:hypothetical protein
MRRSDTLDAACIAAGITFIIFVLARVASALLVG